MNAASLVFLVIAIALTILLAVSGSNRLQFWWQTYQDYLYSAQFKVEHLDNKGYLVFTLMFLFAFKAFIPIYPLSIVCAVSGVVFPIYIAIPINLLGMVIHFTLKYVWGKRIGPGGVSIILKKNEAIRLIMEKDGRGNPWLLVLFRLIPCFPINPVSQLYGSMGFDFVKFLALSLIGYSPLLCMYTVVGRNAYNPLSTGFLLPLIVISLLASVVIYIINVLIYHKKSRRNKNVKHKKYKRATDKR